MRARLAARASSSASSLTSLRRTARSSASYNCYWTRSQHRSLCVTIMAVSTSLVSPHLRAVAAHAAASSSTSSTSSGPGGLTFSWQPSEIAQRSLELQEALRQSFDAAAAVPVRDRSFATVAGPMADLESAVACRSNNLEFLMHVSSSKPVRDAAAAEAVKLEKLSTELMSRRDVYDAVRDARRRELEAAAAPPRSATTRSSSLSSSVEVEVLPVHMRFMDKLLEEFERNGAALP